MPKSTHFLAGLMLVLGCCPALAEVTYDPKALDQLAPAAHAPAHPVTQPAHEPRRRPAPRRVVQHHAAEKPPLRPAVAAPAPHPAMPVVPLAPPPLPNIPPPIFVPVSPIAPPPPAVITATAPGIATPLPGGLRISFGSGRSDLSPATAAALRALAAGRPAGTRFTISAYAPGTTDDPSTPRRLSLSRALTVRSLLIAQGIPSERVYPRPLGAGPGIGDGPPDRADILVTLPPPPAPRATTSVSARTP
jgi:outer membrane protein OmpA-like peptidoglycan-associated protein